MISKCRVFLLVLLFALAPAHAISIDSMMVIADKNGEGTFTIGNGERYRLFVNASLYKGSIEDGELKTELYTRKNISDWEITSAPARTILEPGFEKTFRISYTKNDLATLQRDKIFQIAFSPVPYLDPTQKTSETLQISVGFGALFIVPTESNPPIEYDIVHKGDKLIVTNKGRGFVNFFINGCPRSVYKNLTNQKDCTSGTLILAGRTASLGLTEDMQAADKLRLSIRSYLGKEVKELVISKGQRL